MCYFGLFPGSTFFIRISLNNIDKAICYSEIKLNQAFIITVNKK
jgi:hypothetical protein